MTETTARRLAPVGEPEDPARGPETPEIIAEQSVLGAALRSQDAAAEALALLRPEWFSRGAHRTVFEAIERLADSGWEPKPEDGPAAWQMAVVSELSSTGMLAKIAAPGMGSGVPFLHSLLEWAGSVAFHAPAIASAARRRAILQALESGLHHASQPEFDPETGGEQIRQAIDAAAAYAAPAVLRPNSEAVLEVLADLENEIAPGLSTGWPDLDDAIGGLRRSEVVVVGARPGVGKTLTGLCMADHVAGRLGLPVLFASLEMTENELTQRRISATAKVPLHRVVRHQVDDREWDLIAKAQDALMDTRLFIDDTHAASLAHIRGRIRSMARAGNMPQLVAIDYLGFLSGPQAESRQQQVAALARGVKSLAREFDVPVILLAQLRRLTDGKADREPVLSDLRESGEIEQTADIVILLHRDDMHNRESPRAGEVDLIIAKNRQGPLCTVTLGAQPHYARIVSMAPAFGPGSDWTPASALGGER